MINRPEENAKEETGYNCIPIYSSVCGILILKNERPDSVSQNLIDKGQVLAVCIPKGVL